MNYSFCTKYSYALKRCDPYIFHSGGRCGDPHYNERNCRCPVYPVQPDDHFYVKTFKRGGAIMLELGQENSVFFPYLFHDDYIIN